MNTLTSAQKADIRNITKTSSELVRIDGKLEFVDQQVLPTVYENEDGFFLCAEDGKGYADYYGEFTDGHSGICKELQAVMDKHGLNYEWQNPGTIVIFKD